MKTKVVGTLNVIVILADSLRFDHVGCCGNPWIRTPNIDRLASEGTLFTRAYSEGLPTLPTRTALFTGRYTFPFRGWQGLEPTDVPIAEVLWSQGYTSALVCDTYHMHKPGMAYERGFDYVRWIRGQEGDPYVLDPAVKVDVDRFDKASGRDPGLSARNRAQLEQYLRNRARWRGEGDHFVAQVAKAGMRWLESQEEGDRLFLWLDSFDPHEPWDPPSPYDRMYGDPDYQGRDIIHPVPGLVEGYLTGAELRRVLALYAGEVTLVDRWIGFFLDRVRELGLMEDSLIVFLTDHGEPFGDHGIVRKARPWPYEELIHIPLIIRHPDGVGRGKRVDAFVDTTDVAPTILDFLGIRGPAGGRFAVWPKMHGHSLLPLISGEVEKVREFAVSGHYNRSWSTRDGDWKYIHWLPGAPQTRAKPELYNLRDDPKEKHNLIDKEPETARALDTKLRKFVESLKATEQPPARELRRPPA